MNAEGSGGGYERYDYGVKVRTEWDGVEIRVRYYYKRDQVKAFSRF